MYLLFTCETQMLNMKLNIQETEQVPECFLRLWTMHKSAGKSCLQKLLAFLWCS